MRYDYPHSGRYNETVAITDDGREYLVDTQYGVVQPLGRHTDGCSLKTRIGGRCDCGLREDVMTTAELAFKAREELDALAEAHYRERAIWAARAAFLAQRVEELSRVVVELMDRGAEVRLDTA